MPGFARRVGVGGWARAAWGVAGSAGRLRRWRIRWRSAPLPGICSVLDRGASGSTPTSTTGTSGTAVRRASWPTTPRWSGSSGRAVHRHRLTQPRDRWNGMQPAADFDRLLQRGRQLRRVGVRAEVVAPARPLRVLRYVGRCPRCSAGRAASGDVLALNGPAGGRHRPGGGQRRHRALTAGPGPDPGGQVRALWRPAPGDAWRQ